MKTHEQIASLFNCTPEQVRAQFDKNARQLLAMADKAKSSEGRVNNYTSTQLAKMAAVTHQRARKPFLQAGVIYSADNGERICIHCAGQSALYTGRDRSGQKCKPFGPKDAAKWLALTGRVLNCETGCTSFTS